MNKKILLSLVAVAGLVSASVHAGTPDRHGWSKFREKTSAEEIKKATTGYTYSPAAPVAPAQPTAPVKEFKVKPCHE